MQKQKSNVALSTFNRQIAELTEQSHVLSGLMSQGILDSALFISQTDELNRKIRKLKQAKAQLLNENLNNDTLIATQEIIDFLQIKDESLSPKERFANLVVRIVAFDNKSIDFVLKNGLTLTERL